MTIIRKNYLSAFVLLFCLSLPQSIVKADVGTFDISSTNLSGAIVGLSYSESNSSSIGSVAINFIYNGSCTPVANMNGLPPGMSFSSSTAHLTTDNTDYFGTVTLTGIPAQAGNYTIVLNLNDGCGASASQTFPIEVIAPPDQVTLNTLPLYATVGVPYNDKISFDYSGITVPTFSFTGLPPGIIAGSITNGDQYDDGFYFIPLSGTPQNPGNFNPVLTIINDAGDPFTYQYTFTVSGSTNPTVSNIPIPNPAPTPIPVPTIKAPSKNLPAAKPTSQNSPQPILITTTPSSSPATII